MTFALAILAGGRSVRLGTDKGLFCPIGNETLLARACRLLHPGHSEILVVVKNSHQAQAYAGEVARIQAVCPCPVLLIADSGVTGNDTGAALSGIVTALRFTRAERICSVAVDQVGLRAGLLSKLEHAPCGRCAAFWDEERGEEIPLPSAWNRSVSDPLVELTRAGKFSVKGALRELQAERIPASSAELDALRVTGNSRAELQAYFSQHENE